MSDLRPKGIAVNLDGTERHIVFTLNLIDEIQDKYGKDVMEVLEDITKEKIYGHGLRDLVVLLLNDDAAAPGRYDVEPPQKVSAADVGNMISADNYFQVLNAVMAAYGVSMPEPDEDTDPNGESGSRSMLPA